jgi:hypothetical protein
VVVCPPKGAEEEKTIMTIQKLAVAALSTSLFFGGAGSVPAAPAQNAQALKTPKGLELPISGTYAGGTFAGTVTIQRFAVRDGKPVAIGFVRGAASGESQKTVFAGPIAFPVSVSAAGPLATAADNAVAPQAVAPQAVCQVVNVDLGAVNLNVLGLQVATQPISLALSGDTAGPLGNLVCTLLDLVNNVVGLVGILNTILGLLTGLLGGLGGLLP